MRRGLGLGGVLVAVALLVSGCGEPSGDDSLTATLNGSGSSFQDSLQQTAIGAFTAEAPNATVNYTKSGSSAGKKDLAQENVQFAGTDSLVDPDELPTFRGGELLYFPLAAAPITVSFSLRGIDVIDLTPELIAGIFERRITRWDDPGIAAANPGVDLPDAGIVPVVRSDGSGTTNNFTSYLESAAGTAWTLGSGDTVNWPDGTLAAEKNSGVAALLSSTAGAIGYVDLADAAAAELTRARIRNRAGNFVEAKLPGATAALAAAEVAADLSFSPLDTEGEDAYPITAPTWVVVYARQPDERTRDTLEAYLRFLLTDAQTLAQTVGFAPLPEELQERSLAQLDRLTTR